MDPVESRIRRIGDDHIKNTRLAAYHTMPYDRLVREKLDEIAHALWEFGGISKAGVDFGDYIQYLKTAARAAEKIGEMQAKTLHYEGGTYVLEPLNGKIEQIQEMHQLAEHLKNLLPEKIVEVEEKPKFPEAEKAVGDIGGSSLSPAKLEILSILNGLEFAGFTEEAKRKAVERLSARIAELSEKELTPENLQRLGLYAFAVEMIKRGNFERLREVEKL